MFKKLFILVLCLSVLVACDKFKYTVKNGVKYRIHSHKDGKMPKEGDIVQCQIIMKTAKDSVLRDTHKEPQAMYVRIQKSQFKGGLEDALKLLSVGDSATILIPSDSLFAGPSAGQRPPFIAKGSELKFIVKVIAIPTQAEIQAEQMKAQAAAQASAAKAVALEGGIIDKYIADKKLTGYQTSQTGLRYNISTPGTGNLPKAGATMKLKYIGKLLDGKIFDQNATGVDFPAGVGQVIPGFDEGLMKLKKGAKGTFIIPSKIGYGPQGTGPIPANAILIFDVEVLDIK